MTVGSGAVGSADSASTADPVAVARQHAGRLAAAVEQVRAAYGDTLGVRRLRSDVNRLTECLDELGPPSPDHHLSAPVTLETIPDEPYDESLWVDVEHEGLGAPGRRAP